MTHEPECPTASCLCDENEDCMECVCVCDNLAAAYQRGREDAARDVANTVGYTETWIDGTFEGNGGWRLSVPYDEAVAAARGDGEQA